MAEKQLNLSNLQPAQARGMIHSVRHLVDVEEKK